MSDNIDRTAARRKRFVRVIERRVNKVLNDLDVLSKCSNRRNYEYTDAEVRKIFREIERKLKETRAQFQGEAKGKGGFKL